MCAGSSFNQTPSASLVLISEATDGVARTVPWGTHEVPDSQSRAPSGANLLRNKEADKAPQCAPLPGSSSTKFALHSGAKGSSLSVDSGAYDPRTFPKFLAAKLELKHYFMLITSAVIKRTGHRPMHNPTEPLR